MKALRVKIEGWTASFRYPGFISGFQPTLPVPPLSTIYGLISAAKGELIGPEDVSVGYVFDCEAKAVDLETIYELGKNLSAKSNVVKREFLYNPKLYLYLDKLEFEKYFSKPTYPLVLGRSGDLVTVSEIKTVELNKADGKRLGKTILPFGVDEAYGILQALPTHFTDTIPRKAIGVKPYLLMDEFFTYSKECNYDEEMDWLIWFHK
ncbi:type I-B CRISPR-associated protein Cas5b [Methanococcoides methylutens]|uniref:CRISPR-associated protein, Cas5t family n=1 Tax=Methanococcoides methylutens MM1 TaxID=1434104 RepID=A0A0E3ST14_METMT|nr:type I-B CRISPR-associated protein Cas5b [Methanococcoides methylutens]AKB85838.1 CRISPR-associated protein, Cas5t family [Methanococcoides methylutens MM1]